LSGAPLSALIKKNGDIFRPIAVGKVLRHLVSRIACSAVKSKLPDILLPYNQVGVAIRGGLEAAFHSLQKVILDHADDSTFCCLKIDMSNAFNNCCHSSFLQQVHSDLPELFSWVQWCYSAEGELRFGQNHLLSSAEVQQGALLGPLLFSLVIMELLGDLGPMPDDSLQMCF
jgi:hypothetical protein